MRVVAYPKKSQLNPYNELLYDGVEKCGVEVVDFELKAQPIHADILHLHWVESFTSRASKLTVRRYYKRWKKALKAYKRQGTKIVWTAHNLQQHEALHRSIEEKFWKFFIPMLDGCICLTDDSWNQLKLLRPQICCPHAIVPHGHYRDAYPITTTRESARECLGIPERSFVYVLAGRIRAYKNVPALIHAFRDIKSDVRLIVAGQIVSDELRLQIENAAADDKRISLDFREISNDDLQKYMLAADLAVMPFTQILNSGSALMALSFNTPVLVPAIGSMPELQTTVGQDWVRNFEGKISSGILLDATSWVKCTDRGDRAPLDHLDWDVSAEQTVNFFFRIKGS